MQKKKEKCAVCSCAAILTPTQIPLSKLQCCCPSFSCNARHTPQGGKTHDFTLLLAGIDSIFCVMTDCNRKTRHVSLSGNFSSDQKSSPHILNFTHFSLAWCQNNKFQQGFNYMEIHFPLVSTEYRVCCVEIWSGWVVQHSFFLKHKQNSLCYASHNNKL